MPLIRYQILGILGGGRREVGEMHELQLRKNTGVVESQNFKNRDTPTRARGGFFVQLMAEITANGTLTSLEKTLFSPFLFFR